MKKRVFQRVHGVLKDRDKNPKRYDSTTFLPVGSLGETFTEAEREEAIQLVIEDGSSLPAVYLDEQSDDIKNALLLALSKGSEGAPMALLRFIDSPEVQPALIEAARTRELGELGSFIQAIGIAGGPNAIEVLEEKLELLLVHPDVFKEKEFCNHLASDLEITCGALLQLNPDHLEAARALSLLFEHPCQLDQETSIRTAGSLHCIRLQTRAMKLLQTRLSLFLEHEMSQLFIHAAPALIWLEPAKTMTRIERLSSDADPNIRERVIDVLPLLPGFNSQKVVALQLSMLERETELPLALRLIAGVGTMVPKEQRVKWIKEGLQDTSPVLRMDAASLLHQLPLLDRRTLASMAIQMEPDPSLQQYLQRYMDT